MVTGADAPTREIEHFGGYFRLLLEGKGAHGAPKPRVTTVAGEMRELTSRLTLAPSDQVMSGGRRRVSASGHENASGSRRLVSSTGHARNTAGRRLADSVRFGVT